MKANLGCGGVIADGWINIDLGNVIEGTLHPEIQVLDMTRGLPFSSDEVEYAVAHHVVDLMTPKKLRAFLAECHRVIQPHGILRISIADARGAIKAAEKQDWHWFDMLERPDDTDGLDLLHEYLWLHGARKTFLTAPMVTVLLREAGFTPYIVADNHTVYGDSSVCNLDSRIGESIFLEGVA